MAEVHSLAVTMFINGSIAKAGDQVTVPNGWTPPQAASINHSDPSKAVMTQKATRIS